MKWAAEDFSQYHTAKSAWYSLYPDGKVDIGIEHGHEQKVSLQPSAMLKLTEEWLKNGHGLNDTEKQKLIKLLSK